LANAKYYNPQAIARVWYYCWTSASFFKSKKASSREERAARGDGGEVPMRGGGEAKPGKSQKSSAQRHLNAGFVVVGLLMLLAYLVAQHFVVGSRHGT
jgi:hypothetical protein